MVRAATDLSRSLLQLLGIPEVDEMLLTYLKTVSSQMVNACRHNAAPAWPVIYLAANPEVWSTLDSLRKAEAVLKAKEWREVSPFFASSLKAPRKEAESSNHI